MKGNRVSVTIDGIEYISMADAAEKLGLTKSTVARRCKSTNYPTYISKHTKETRRQTHPPRPVDPETGEPKRVVEVWVKKSGVWKLQIGRRKTL